MTLLARHCEGCFVSGLARSEPVVKRALDKLAVRLIRVRLGVKDVLELSINVRRQDRQVLAGPRRLHGQGDKGVKVRRSLHPGSGKISHGACNLANESGAIRQRYDCVGVMTVMKLGKRLRMLAPRRTPQTSDRVRATR